MSEESRVPAWKRHGDTWTHPEAPYEIRYRPEEVKAGDRFEVRTGDREFVAVRWSLDSAKDRPEEVWQRRGRG